MRRVALVAGLLVAGCGPTRMGQPYFPNVTADWSYVQHPGDKLLLGADAPDATVDVTFKNHATFPKYVVPEGSTRDGKPAVLTPTTLELTLSHTDPAALVALKVY
jgi:hypothetical protein